MKLFETAIVALVCLVASWNAAPTDKVEALICKVAIPDKATTWEIGKQTTVGWTCKIDGPLNKAPAQNLIHIELGTGTKDDFTYLDTIDAVAKAREEKFQWILLDKYKPGNNYLVRLRGKLKDAVDPVAKDAVNKLPWDYSPAINIVAAGGAGAATNPTGGKKTDISVATISPTATAAADTTTPTTSSTTTNPTDNKSSATTTKLNFSVLLFGIAWGLAIL